MIINIDPVDSEDESFFVNEVNNAIKNIMEPYGQESEDYYKFIGAEEDGETEELFSKGTTKGVKYPNGTILHTFDYRFTKYFSIENDVIYQKEAGHFKKPKRTKKSKKLQYLPKCNYRRIYKSYNIYLEECCGYYYNEENQAYGHSYNPDSHWDG